MALPISVAIQKEPGYERTDRVQLRIDGATVDAGSFTPYADGGTSGTTTVKTLASYVAGDYDIEARATDIAGNTSAWSTAVEVQHRPRPPKPFNLAIDANTNTFTWCWTDPGDMS